ncbi:MAG: DUF932 domain-containing protein [Chroococcidiopsis sp.]
MTTPAVVSINDEKAYHKVVDIWEEIGGSRFSEGTSISQALNLKCPWEVVSEPIKVPIGSRTVYEKRGQAYIPSVIPIYGEDDNYIRLCRSDNQSTLGVVTPSYNPISNKESFEYLNRLVDTGLLRVEAMALMDGGAKVFMELRMKDTCVSIGPDELDQLELRFIASTSHDTSIGWSLQAAVYSKKTRSYLSTERKIAFKHTVNVSIDPLDIDRFLVKSKQDYTEFVALCTKLTSLEMNLGQFHDVLCLIYPKRVVKGSLHNWKGGWSALSSIFDGGVSLSNMPHTAYRGFLAVGIYHSQIVGGTTRPEHFAARFFSVICKEGAKFLTRSESAFLSLIK